MNQSERQLPKCNGWCENNTVTHIGSKGYVYCTPCAQRRRESGYESTRKMRAWELDLIASGQPLPTYEARPKTVRA